MRPIAIRSLGLALGLSLWIMAGLALQSGCAYAQSARGVELLSRAEKFYQAGAYSDAADSIESAFKAGLSGELAARAIFLRAEISESQGELAKALQDYSNALWMEALPSAERKKAEAGKERVMAAMGLAQPGGGASEARASASRPDNSSGGGVFGFFNSVFGGSGTPPAPPPAELAVQPAAAPPPQPAVAPKTAAVAKPAAKPAKTAHAKQPAVPQGLAQPTSALSVAAAAGEALIVFGSTSSEASGRAAAQSIKTRLSDIFVHRDLDVTPRAGGSFQIQAGPYPKKSSAVALCAAIQERGIPCHVTQ